YTNGYKTKVQNRQPIIATKGIHATPPQDMYFKGSLFLNTLRNVVNDDKRWFSLIRDVFQNFKYQTITTEEMVEFINRKTGLSLTPLFDQYLRYSKLPTLELQFNEAAKTVSYRWATDVQSFAMPVRVGKKNQWQIIQPTTEWKTMPTSLARNEFEVATD